MVLDWSTGMAVFGWSVVFYRHSNTLQLCAPCLPQLWHFPVNFPYVMPNSIGVCSPLFYYIVIKIGYFYLLFWAWDYPTVANVDPNSLAACITALRYRGFYALTQASVVGL